MKTITANKYRIILFSLLLFIATQYSAVVHASVHFFHTPDSLCSTLSAIEHSASGLINYQITIPSITPQTSFVVLSYTTKPSAYYIFLPSRAPPRAI